MVACLMLYSFRQASQGNIHAQLMVYKTSKMPALSWLLIETYCVKRDSARQRMHDMKALLDSAVPLQATYINTITFMLKATYCCSYKYK